MAEVVDLTKHLTLDQIRDRDIDNQALVWKACKPVKFESPGQCKFWVGETLRKILAKLGVDLVLKITGNTKADEIQHELAAKRVDRQMKQKGVKVESRDYPKDQFTRSGIYVYYANEIAYFISHPMHSKKREGLLILRGSNGGDQGQLFCMTNWKE